jgi:spore coat protein U-like protein
VGNDFSGEDSMNKAIRLLAAGALLAAGVPLSAMAQTITITASVASQCNLNSPTVALGALTLISGTITNTGMNLVLTCNKGATVSVALSDGGNFSGGSKRMSNGGGEFINYNISRPTLPLVAVGNTCPALPGTEWDGTNTVAGTPMFSASGGPRSIPLCVSVPTPQFPGAGSFSDTVTATLTVT